MVLESKIKRLTEVRQFVKELIYINSRIVMDNVTFLEDGTVDTIEDGKVYFNGILVGYFTLTGKAGTEHDDRRLNFNIEYQYGFLISDVLNMLNDINARDFVDVVEYDYEIRRREEEERLAEQMRLEEEERRKQEELAQKEQEKAEQEDGSDFGKIEDLLPGDETKDPVEDEVVVPDYEPEDKPEADPDPIPEDEPEADPDPIPEDEPEADPDPIPEDEPVEDDLAQKEQEKAEQEEGSNCGKIEDLLPKEEKK